MFIDRMVDTGKAFSVSQMARPAEAGRVGVVGTQLLVGTGIGGASAWGEEGQRQRE